MKMPENINRKALISLVLSVIALIWGLFFPLGMIAGLILAVIAIVLGILARREKAGAMATAGIVIGVIALTFIVPGIVITVRMA